MSVAKVQILVFRPLTFLLMWIWSYFVVPTKITAQETYGCGTKSPVRPYFTPAFPAGYRSNETYQIKIFIHIIAESDGTGPAVEMTDLMSQLEATQSFFAPADICLKLVGIQQINSSDLMEQRVDEEEDDLLPFLVGNAINIFIHKFVYEDDKIFGGSAYDIPNNYLSVDGDIMASEDRFDLIAHELGHCLGLYHTFETGLGSENVTRNGICRNCDFTGDLLCDTPADPHDTENYDSGQYIDQACEYSGTIRDDCTESLYQPDTRNIMAYGKETCHDHFSAQQGERMRAMILNEDILTDCLVPNNITLSPAYNENTVFGRKILIARNSLIVQGINFEISGAASGLLSANSITLLPRTRLRPVTGEVVVTPENQLCD
ncbi:MAG: hypothetical protein KDC49_05755 [Saprospiraceae bacterium]|nr:hypothetical protein [Saprospiraceae bacterium]